MPVLNPAELWQQSGRYEHRRALQASRTAAAPTMVLAMTHEEIVTMHVAQVVRSYRDLPLILYHFQTKERDEPRPRAGVLRTREFIMKDSYTFDRDPEGLDAATSKHVEAYDRIFDRAGLEWYRVESDVGMMGGLGRARVHGAVRGGRERRGARARLRGQRRGRERRRRSPSSSRRARRARGGPHAGHDHRRRGRRAPRRARPARC